MITTIPLGVFLDHYLKDIAAHTPKSKTIASYIYIIEKHINPHLEHVKLNQLRPDQLYSEKLNVELSRRTVYYIYQILHRTLEQAMKWGLVRRNDALD